MKRNLCRVLCEPETNEKVLELNSKPSKIVKKTRRSMKKNVKKC